MSEVPYPRALADHPTLRQSLLAVFDRCSLATDFELRYRKGWSSHPAARGQIMHRVFARCLQTMHDEKEETIPVDVALAILAECLRQADVPDRDFVNIPAKEIQDMRWVTVKWAHDNAFNVPNLVGVEFPVEAIVHYDNPAGGFVARKLTGRLDAVFLEGEGSERAVVVDWKDTFGMPPASSVSDVGFFQQRAYAFLLLKRYPQVQEVILREFYVRYSEPREARIHRHQLDEIEGVMTALAERFDRAYETAIWTPSPGAHCAFCPRPTACPIFPSARLEGAISSPEEAARVSAELVVAKAALDQRTKAIKAWTAAHGDSPIKSDKTEKAWGHREAMRVKRPDREAMEAAVRAGNVDLDSLYKEEKHTRFGLHSAQKREPEAEDAALMGALEESLRRVRDDQ